VAPIGGEDAGAVAVFKDAQTALADIRRIKAMEKRAVKSVIERAELPRTLEGLTPAARDFQAATHIRALTFDHGPTNPCPCQSPGIYTRRLS